MNALFLPFNTVLHASDLTVSDLMDLIGQQYITFFLTNSNCLLQMNISFPGQSNVISALEHVGVWTRSQERRSKTPGYSS